MVLGRWKSFCTTLKDSPHNVGQHGKEFDCYFIDKHLDLLDAIIDHCPNIEVLNLLRRREVCDYIVTSGQKKKTQEEELVLWKNLQKLDIHLLYHRGNSVYRCFYFFHNSLNHLSLSSKPNMEVVTLQGIPLEEVTKEDEESEGRLADISRYIVAFKHLELLQLKSSTSGSVFDLEGYFSNNCSNKLKKLNIQGLKDPWEPGGM